MLAALRAREFGLLRVVGATPRQLGLLVVSEAAVVGAVASLVGAAVGVGAAAGLLAWLASKDLLPPGLAPRWATLGFALVMGTTVAVAASLPAALRAGRTPPLRTLRDGTAASSRPLAWAAVAVAVAVGGAALVLGGISTAHGGRIVAGAGLCLVALVVGLPLVVGGLAGPLRRIGRPLGITVRLGAENATRNQRRTAATVAALIVAVASIAAVATYATSWQAATSAALTGSVHADLIVQHATAVGQESTFIRRWPQIFAAWTAFGRSSRSAPAGPASRAPRPPSTRSILEPSGRSCGCGCAPAASPGCAMPRCWSRPGRHAGTPSASGTP